MATSNQQRERAGGCESRPRSFLLEEPSWQPRIDVLIPTLNEGRHIKLCLEAVLNQTFPAELTRVLVIDGGSTDDTLDVCSRYESMFKRIRVIRASGLNVPETLNLAIQGSTGEVIAKIDAHGFPERDYLERAVQVLAAGGASTACVGGRPLQIGVTPFGRALAVARMSAFGVGRSDYATTASHASVRSVQCGIYRRRALEVVGAFDERMPFGEDEEVNWRLLRAGYEVLLDTRIRFHYFTRSTWPAAFLQYFNYGGGRFRVVMKHPSFARVHHLAPPAFVVSLLLAGGVAPRSAKARRWLVWSTAFYLGASWIAARIASRGEGAAGAGLVMAAYVALHGGYAAGALYQCLVWWLPFRRLARPAGRGAHV